MANNLQLGQLDDFACRQLDRLTPATPKAPSPKFKHDILDGSDQYNERTKKRNLGEKDKTFVEDVEGTVVGTVSSDPASQVVAVVSRSRWQTVLLEAGGLGAAVSEESLKSLRYCLQWLLVSLAHSRCDSD